MALVPYSAQQVREYSRTLAAQAGRRVELYWRHRGDATWRHTIGTVEVDEHGVPSLVYAEEGHSQSLSFPGRGIEFANIRTAEAVATLVHTLQREQQSLDAERRRLDRTREDVTDQQRELFAQQDQIQGQIDQEWRVINEAKDGLRAQELELRAAKEAATRATATEKEKLEARAREVQAAYESAKQRLTQQQNEGRERIKQIEDREEALQRRANELDAQLRRREEAVRTREASLLQHQQDLQADQRQRDEREREREQERERMREWEREHNERRDRENDRQLTRGAEMKQLTAVLSSLVARIDNIERGRTRENPEVVDNHSSSSSSSSDDDAATDDNTEESCNKANKRWTKLERQLQTNERATGTYASAACEPTYFEAEYRRRMRIPPSAPAHYVDVVEAHLQVLVGAHRLVKLLHEQKASAKVCYAAHKQLRLAQIQAGRIQLQLANANSEAYQQYDSELNSIHRKNRRGKTAFVGIDTILSKIVSVKKYTKNQRGGGAGGRGSSRGGRNRGRAGPKPISDTDSVSSSTSRTKRN